MDCTWLTAALLILLMGVLSVVGSEPGNGHECSESYPAVVVGGDGGTPCPSGQQEEIFSNIRCTVLKSVVACLSSFPEHCEETVAHGGGGGEAFNETYGCQGVQISGFEISHTPFIHGLRFHYNINGTERTGGLYGNLQQPDNMTDGTWSNATVLVNVTLDLEAGEKITCISGRSGLFVDQLEFITNKGRKLGPYGDNGGGAFNVMNCNEPRGIFGRHDNSTNNVVVEIGFYCTVYSD